MFDVCTTGDTVHIDTIVKFLPHTRQHGCIDILHRYNDPCLKALFALSIVEYEPLGPAVTIDSRYVVGSFSGWIGFLKKRSFFTSWEPADYQIVWLAIESFSQSVSSQSVSQSASQPVSQSDGT
jgi:hypothetical protein